MQKAIRLVIGIVAVIAVGARAQTPPPQEPQDQKPAVTFRTGVDLVAVDVSVVDREGRPVADLKPEDFGLKVDGEPRTLVSVQFVRQVRQVAPPTPRDASFSSNQGASSGRLIMIVVDQANIRRGSGKTVVDAAARFIDQLNPADRVGLKVIPGEGQNVDFTTNHALVKTLLGNIVGRMERTVGNLHIGIADAMDLVVRDDRMTMERIIEREVVGMLTEEEKATIETAAMNEARQVMAQAQFRTSESLIALRGLLASLAGTTEPKTIVFVSEALVLQDRRSQLSWVGPLASAAHASIYVLRLEPTLFDTAERQISATIQSDVFLEIEGLEMLAGMARGAIFPVTSNTDYVFDRLALELSGYYLLSFEPEGSDRDGKPHQIDVDVNLDRVEVRARREFTVDADRATMTDEDLLAETLRAHLLATELPLQVATYTFPDVASGQLKVMIAAEVDRGEGAAGDLSLAYALVDNKGNLAGTQIEKGLAMAPGSGGVQAFTSAVLVDPGIYTLKLAVLDAEGKRGSVEHTFRAGLQATGQLRFGDLMLAQLPRGTRAASVRPVVNPEVTADSLHAYLEMYSDATPQLEAATADLEVAADSNGKAIESAEIRLQPVENGKRRVGEGSVPTVFLPPGQYVARAIISVSGRPVARVTREFRIARPLPPVAPEAVPPAPGSSPRVALASTIERFDTGQVLEPQVLSFFLDRMFVPGSPPPSPSIQAIIDQARVGRLDAVQTALDALDPATARELTPVFLRGLALLSLGDLEGSAGQFRESLRLSSEFLPAAFYLGACYAAGGRDREAAGAWQTSLVTEDEAPFVYTLLGDALMRINESLQAVEILREAANIWPDNDDVRARLGTAYVMTGNGVNALDTLDPYFFSHPDDTGRLFVAMRLLYETKTAGRSIDTPEQDRTRFERYAKAYLAADGPDAALVEQWLKYMREPRQ